MGKFLKQAAFLIYDFLLYYFRKFSDDGNLRVKYPKTKVLDRTASFVISNCPYLEGTGKGEAKLQFQR